MKIIRDSHVYDFGFSFGVQGLRTLGLGLWRFRSTATDSSADPLQRFIGWRAKVLGKIRVFFASQSADVSNTAALTALVTTTSTRRSTRRSRDKNEVTQTKIVKHYGHWSSPGC